MATEILNGLWLGNIIDSKNTEFINKIDIIINASINIPFTSDKTTNIRIKVEDNLQKDEIIKMYNYLDNITKYIYDSLMNNKTIFVHCYAGKQRSATIVCAYIMRYLNLSYKEATKLMKTKRIVVFTPLPNFDNALRLFQEKCN
jgi:protein-tyrosine phosphatase